MVSPVGPGVQASIHAEELDARLVPHAAEARDATRVAAQNDVRAPGVLPLAEEQRNEAQPGEQQLAVIRFGEPSATRLEAQAPAWFPCEGLEKDATRHAARKLRAVLASAYPPELDGMSHGVRFWTDRDAIRHVMVAFWFRGLSCPRAPFWFRFVLADFVIRCEQSLFEDLSGSSALRGLLDRFALLRREAPDFVYSCRSGQSGPLFQAALLPVLSTRAM